MTFHDLVVTFKNFHNYPFFQVFPDTSQFNRHNSRWLVKCRLFLLFINNSLFYFILAKHLRYWTVINLPFRTLIFQNFHAWWTIKYHSFPGLENEIVKFNDFPGFPCPIPTHLSWTHSKIYFAHLSITSIKTGATQALVFSPDKLLCPNRLFTFITSKAFLMESFALISNLFLSWCKITSTCFTHFGWCNSTTEMTYEFIILKGETLIKLQRNVIRVQRKSVLQPAIWASCS